ncbi:adenylosuccinate lyase [Candidatus Borrarchaeum sp.]|uniref:adenylosuccinate lyase n=1 Tax=Candidatus Borrarchaeum sp. TaxID=2846742 RepID=UPI00257C6EE4|nr:adenylosuccinate lyase [Candidatus Borrarchaeum sp.]
MIHPTDQRYLVKELIPFFSEEGFLEYKLKVEKAYVRALNKIGVCPEEIADEIIAQTVTALEVKQKEAILKHDIRALVEVLRDKISTPAKPYVHLGLTSYDVVNTAQALLIKDATKKVLLLHLVALELELIRLAKEEKNTLQIGRTHGQHAEPTTFGKEIAVFVDRIGHAIIRIKNASDNLRGKLSGAVGSKASLSLIHDPDELESIFMKELSLNASPITTQRLPPEELTNYMCQITITFGTIADLANDLRHLQRSEIGEVAEYFEKTQVGSSTMPQKRNPINLENIISQYRAVMPHIITALLNIESEHQRDLRDSASTRYILPEVLNAFVHSINRLIRVIKTLKVDRGRMKENLKLNRDFYLAEPAYVQLALQGDPQAYDKVRELTLKAQKENKPLSKLLTSDLLETIGDYTGTCKKQVDKVTKYWETKISELADT